MKRINREMIKLRIRLLQKILAVIGISALISSCGNNTSTQEEDNTDTVSSEVLLQDTVVEQVIIPDTVKSKPEPVKEKPKQNNGQQTVPPMNKPDGPVTKYGVPADYNDNIQVRYGVPSDVQPDLN